MQIRIDGQMHEVPEGISVAAALAVCGDGTTRTSVSGARRAPVCGMGICQECRVQVDGVRRLACQTPCVDGMEVVTGVTGSMSGEPL